MQGGYGNFNSQEYNHGLKLTSQNFYPTSIFHDNFDEIQDEIPNHVKNVFQNYKQSEMNNNSSNNGKMGSSDQSPYMQNSQKGQLITLQKANQPEMPPQREYEFQQQQVYNSQILDSQLDPLTSKSIDPQSSVLIKSNVLNTYYATSLQNGGLAQSSAGFYSLQKTCRSDISTQLKKLSNQSCFNRDRSFLVEVSVFHPIGSKVLLRFYKRIDNIFLQNSAIIMDLSKAMENDIIYELNHIIIPFSEFRLHLTVYNIHQHESEQRVFELESYIDLKPYKNENTVSILADNSKVQMCILGQLIGNNNSTNGKMNGHSSEDFFRRNPLQLEIVNLEIKIHQFFNLSSSPLLSDQKKPHLSNLIIPKNSINNNNNNNNNNHISNNNSTNGYEQGQSPTPAYQNMGLTHEMVHQPFSPDINQPRKTSNSSQSQQSPNKKFGLRLQKPPKMNITAARKSSGNSLSMGSQSPEINSPFIMNSLNINSIEDSVRYDEAIAEQQSLSDIENVAQVLMTQQGSRLIQKMFSKATNPELDNFILRIQNHMAELMVDNYANYVFGALVEHCSQPQRFRILQIVSPNIVQISSDKKGTHALQAIISVVVQAKEEELVINSITPNILELSMDGQATHFIKKVVNRFSIEKINLMFDILEPHFLKIINHQCGLCIFKEFMNRFNQSENRIYQIVDLLQNNIDDIAQDPFGNYAIQHAISIYKLQQVQIIIDKVQVKLVQLSNQKFSSNVVEKCMLHTNHEIKLKFIRHMCRDDMIVDLMKNRFGNFMINKALDKATNEEYSLLISAIQRNLQNIHTSTYKLKWQEYLDQIYYKQQ